MSRQIFLTLEGPNDTPKPHTTGFFSFLARCCQPPAPKVPGFMRSRDDEQLSGFWKKLRKLKIGRGIKRILKTDLEVAKGLIGMKQDSKGTIFSAKQLKGYTTGAKIVAAVAAGYAAGPAIGAKLGPLAKQGFGQILKSGAGKFLVKDGAKGMLWEITKDAAGKVTGQMFEKGQVPDVYEKLNDGGIEQVPHGQDDPAPQTMEPTVAGTGGHFGMPGGNMTASQLINTTKAQVKKALTGGVMTGAQSIAAVRSVTPSDRDALTTPIESVKDMIRPVTDIPLRQSEAETSQAVENTADAYAEQADESATMSGVLNSAKLRS